nr:putative ribonuclease H-like domain-containing protein [Tanacetum cinerariifolium]
KVTNRHLLSSTRVKPSTSASGSKPSGNTKNDRISRPLSSNEKNKVEAQSRKIKSRLNKKKSDFDNVCNEHVKHFVKGDHALCLFAMNGSIVSDVPSSSLIDCRLSKLFCGTLKFGNDQVAKIMGYGDYQIGNVTISRVYYVERLGHNLFSVGISHETSVAHSPQQNGIVERRNRTLIEAAHTMLIYARASLFLWAEAVATACYT